MISIIIAAATSSPWTWAFGTLALVLAGLVAWLRRRLRETEHAHQQLMHSLNDLQGEFEATTQRQTSSVESRFEHLLAVVSTDFVHVRPDQCHDLIRRSLTSLHAFLEIDAIGVCEFSADKQSVFLVSECVDGSQSTYGVDLKAQAFRKISELPARRFWEHALKGKTTAVADTQANSRETTEDERRYFRDRGVKSFLQVPMKVEDSVLGLLGLRSLTKHYEWDSALVSQIELVAQVFANALHRKRTDEEIAKLQRFGTLISKVSGNFVDLAADHIKDAIETSLRQLGEFIGAARCSIYQISETPTSIERVYEWTAPDAEAEIPETNRLSLSYYPWFQQCYREGTPIAMSSIYDIPSYAAPERNFASKLHAKSFLIMPMRLAGQPIGHVGFSMDQPNHPWSAELIDQARLVAELFANALERQRKESELAAIELRYRTIVEDQTEWILRWRPDGTRIFVNPSYCERFGRSAQALLGTNFLQEARTEDRERICLQVDNLTPTNPVTSGLRKSHLPDGSTSWEQWTDRAFFDEDGKLTEIQSVGFDMTKQQQAEQKAANLQREFQQTLINSQEAERARLARELHDELGQSLTALRMQTRAMQKRLETNDPDTLTSLDSSLDEMIDIVDTTIPEVRRLCAELRPSILDNLGLVAAMEWQLDKFQQNTGIRCNQGFLMSELPTHPRRDIAMFRIFQELLTNVARHAKATELWTSLHLSDDQRLILEVRDNGRGVTEDEMAETTHFGLLGIRERAAAINGTFTIQGRPEVGTTATVSIATPDLTNALNEDESPPSDIESCSQD